MAGKVSRSLSTLRAPMFSPMGFLLRAGVIFVVYLLVELSGLRDYTSFLSGTSATGDKGDMGAAFFGAVYTLFYFLAVLAVPILVIGSGFLALLSAWDLRRKEDAAGS